MPFPTTPILTTFAGADENPLSEGGNWVANVDTDDADLQILSNQAAGTAAGAGSMYWTTTYGPDCEVYVLVPTLPVGLDTAVYLRLADMGGATPDGYQGRMITDFGSPHLAIYNRMDNGAFTQLGGNVDLTWVAGDQLGMSAVGSTLVMYQNGTALGTSRTDATYSASGKIGLRATTTTPRLDSFGGGNVVVGRLLDSRVLGGVLSEGRMVR